MKNRTVRIFFTGAIVLFITALLVWPAIDRKQVARADSATDRKSLTRKYDLVIVNGQWLRNFHGIAIEKLALLGAKEGKLAPIPFQIDERDGQGQFVMTSGKTAGRDDDGGKLDGNDELVFYIKDAGDRLPPTQLSDKIEIEVTDPRHPDRHAWAYLVYFKTGEVPRSKVDYLKYDPAAQRIISKNYILGFDKGFVFPNDLFYPKSAGGNGQDFIDRTKFRIKLEFLGGVVNIGIDEDDMSSEVLGWVDGPVRTLRSTKIYVTIFDGFPPVSMKIMNEYSQYMSSIPLNIRMPFNLNTVFKYSGVRRFEAEAFGDLPGLVGGKRFSNLAPEEFTLTGHMPQQTQNKVPTKGGVVWGVSTKKGVGTFFSRLVFPDVTYQFIDPYITDDASYDNPPDDVPGEIGSGIRVNFVDFPPGFLNQISHDSFTCMLDLYYAPPGLTASGAREWLDIRDFPLLVDVRAGSAVNSPRASVKAPAAPPWEGGRDGTITDIRDRKISLKKIAFFMGSIEADARSVFPGERMTDATFHNCPLAKTKSVTNYYVDFDPHTKTQNAMFSKVVATDGSTLDLLGCKICGWGGLDDEGRVAYYSNAQIKRIDFVQGN